MSLFWAWSGFHIEGLLELTQILIKKQVQTGHFNTTVTVNVSKKQYNKFFKGTSINFVGIYFSENRQIKKKTLLALQL